MEISKISTGLQHIYLIVHVHEKHPLCPVVETFSHLLFLPDLVIHTMLNQYFSVGTLPFWVG